MVDPKFKRRAAARPDEMLDGALDIFLEKGFAATRVEEIAQRAGVSKGSIYRYFPSKHALMEGLVKRAVTPISEQSVSVFGQFKGHPRELITHVIRSIADSIADPKINAVPKLIMREAVTFPQISQLYREQVIEAAMPAFIMMINSGIEGGYFRELDAEMVVRCIVGPLVAHMLLAEVFGVQPKGGLQIDALIETHLSILFDGLCA